MSNCSLIMTVSYQTEQYIILLPTISLARHVFMHYEYSLASGPVEHKTSGMTSDTMSTVVSVFNSLVGSVNSSVPCA